MRRSSFIRVHTSRTWCVAEEMVGRLRQAGLHPAELSLTTPLAPLDANPAYPIEVPVEEADLARELLKSGDNPSG
jgi:hypothetical protein